MAPPTGATGKAGTGSGGRQLRKPVVPVVPLPFVQRQPSNLRTVAAPVAHAATAATAQKAPNNDPTHNRDRAEHQTKKQEQGESELSPVPNGAMKNGTHDEASPDLAAEAATPSAAPAKIAPPASPGRNGVGT